jgi:COMPASS component SWD1
LLVNINGDYHELPLDDLNECNVISSFDRRGEHVYCGNGKGKISVFRSSTRELVTSFRVTNGSASNSAVKQIEFASRGTSFLIRTGDRIIRIYNTGSNGEPCGDAEPVHKLQDLVNRTLWKRCCFSGDGEYICAGASRQHSLYIWEKNGGQLVKILHGTKGKMLLDIAWHPIKALLASVSCGIVSLWSKSKTENLTAYAPNFKELDENVQYEERESEYDQEDEDKSLPPSENEEEEVDVDVTNNVSTHPLDSRLDFKHFVVFGKLNSI